MRAPLVPLGMLRGLGRQHQELLGLASSCARFEAVLPAPSSLGSDRQPSHDVFGFDLDLGFTTAFRLLLVGDEAPEDLESACAMLLRCAFPEGCLLFSSTEVPATQVPLVSRQHVRTNLRENTGARGADQMPSGPSCRTPFESLRRKG